MCGPMVSLPTCVLARPAGLSRARSTGGGRRAWLLSQNRTWGQLRGTTPRPSRSGRVETRAAGAKPASGTGCARETANRGAVGPRSRGALPVAVRGCGYAPDRATAHLVTAIVPETLALTACPAQKMGCFRTHTRRASSSFESRRPRIVGWEDRIGRPERARATRTCSGDPRWLARNIHEPKRLNGPMRTTLVPSVCMSATRSSRVKPPERPGRLRP